MAKNAHQPIPIAALHLTHEVPLELRQAPVRKIKRYRDARDAVRRKPLLSQPTMRTKADPAGRELAVQALDRPLELGARNGQLEIAETQAEQLFVGQRLPRVCAGASTAPLRFRSL